MMELLIAYSKARWAKTVLVILPAALPAFLAKQKERSMKGLRKTYSLVFYSKASADQKTQSTLIK